MPSTNIWQQSQVHGERLRKRLPSVKEGSVSDASPTSKPPQGVSLDGGMMHIRGEGWKEFKVGAVFNIEQHLKRDPNSHTKQLLPHATQLDYTAVLGNVDPFEPVFNQLIQQRGCPPTDILCVNADGAEWIWNLAKRSFPHSTHIVDWYHARQHLYQAAQAFHTNDKSGMDECLTQWTEALFAGDLDVLTFPLDKAGFSQYSHYFHTHRERMQYQRFRDAGLPIGSGTIESGVKQFKARLTGAGMRWSRVGAERMLAIRSAVLGCDFDRLWDAA